MDYRERLEIASANAVEQFIEDITPRMISRRVQLDYSDENQEPILDQARNGQVREAAISEQFEYPNKKKSLVGRVRKTILPLVAKSKEYCKSWNDFTGVKT